MTTAALDFEVTEAGDIVEQCNAAVRDSIRRCSRPAVGITGVCLQHRVFGGQYPGGGWDAAGMPVGVWQTIVGTRDGGIGCA